MSVVYINVIIGTVQGHFFYIRVGKALICLWLQSMGVAFNQTLNSQVAMSLHFSKASVAMTLLI